MVGSGALHDKSCLAGFRSHGDPAVVGHQPALQSRRPIYGEGVQKTELPGAAEEEVPDAA